MAAQLQGRAFVASGTAPLAPAASATTASPSAAAAVRAASTTGASRPRLRVTTHALRGRRVLPRTAVTRLPSAIGILTLDVSVPVRVHVVLALRHAIGLLKTCVALLGARSIAVAVAGLVVEVVVRGLLRWPRGATGT